MIPIATAVGFISYISAHAAFWPVWGWLTPLILCVMMFGYLMAGSFMPRGHLGSALFVSLFVAAALSAHYIPHEGHLH